MAVRAAGSAGADPHGNSMIRVSISAPDSNAIIIAGTKKLSVGHSIYDFYLRDWADVDPQTGAPRWYVTGADGKRTTTGTYSSATQYYSGGSALPDAIGGLTNTFSYKGVSLSFLWVYSLGGKVLDNDDPWLTHLGSATGRAWSTEILDRWQKPGDVTNVPALSTNTSTFTSATTRWLYDATYARLKNLNLSYTFPKSLMERAHLNNLVVYVQGENLITLYKHKGMDPEQSIDGVTYYRYPAIKSLSAGINLGF